MPSLTDIKAAATALCKKTAADCTVNSVDLGLLALNNCRKTLELQYDFEFQRKLVTLSVNGATGGALSSAVLYGTATAASIKTVLDVGLFDSDNNLVPTEWTTVAEGLERLRSENLVLPRYPSDGETSLMRSPTFALSGDTLYKWPKDTSTYAVGIEAYVFDADWTDLSTTPAPWATVGAQMLLYGTVIHLNKLFEQFVSRQEGALPEPKELFEQAVRAFVDWDIFRYEQSRRHAR